MAGVAQSDEFKHLMRESAEVAEQCQQMLQTEWLKTPWRNVMERRNTITNHLLASLKIPKRVIPGQGGP